MNIYGIHDGIAFCAFVKAKDGKAALVFYKSLLKPGAGMTSTFRVSAPRPLEELVAECEIICADGTRTTSGELAND